MKAKWLYLLKQGRQHLSMSKHFTHLRIINRNKVHSAQHP